eukprot:TRINITY_DN69603_c0_g1_i1.p1 TRINITY_DN69603_c0_g1~~TRINITY_DN69603_c0_g1_i1.p1  ORF type:complete len:472 (+),score=60.83 TRINITY_DN69603_c0_g1_i1:72-1487(+)
MVPVGLVAMIDAATTGEERPWKRRAVAHANREDGHASISYPNATGAAIPATGPGAKPGCVQCGVRRGGSDVVAERDDHRRKRIRFADFQASGGCEDVNMQMGAVVGNPRDNTAERSISSACCTVGDSGHPSVHHYRSLEAGACVVFFGETAWNLGQSGLLAAVEAWTLAGDLEATPAEQLFRAMATEADVSSTWLRGSGSCRSGRSARGRWRFAGLPGTVLEKDHGFSVDDCLPEVAADPNRWNTPNKQARRVRLWDLRAAVLRVGRVVPHEICTDAGGEAIGNLHRQVASMSAAVLVPPPSSLVSFLSNAQRCLLPRSGVVARSAAIADCSYERRQPLAAMTVAPLPPFAMPAWPAKLRTSPESRDAVVDADVEATPGSTASLAAECMTPVPSSDGAIQRYSQHCEAAKSSVAVRCHRPRRAQSVLSNWRAKRNASPAHVNVAASGNHNAVGGRLLPRSAALRRRIVVSC